jgi:uncharacterized protein (TIGR02453 family)
MTDPFAQLIPEARTFLGELSAHNEKAWFTEHKPRYEAELKVPATHLLDTLAADLGKHGRPAKAKLFRPHRDVRFSKDKTPYHEHLHMLWDLGATGLFFGVAPGYVRIGGGVMGFDKARLTAWRQGVNGEPGDQIAAELDILRLRGLAPEEPELKRVPSPYGAEHPHGDLLRRKSLTVWQDVPQSRWDHPLDALHSAFATLFPLLDLLEETTAV